MTILYLGRLARCAGAMLIAVLAAACAQHNRTPSPTGYAEVPVSREVADAQVLLTGDEFVRCLRDHGVTDVPDFIVHNGRLGWADEAAAGRAAVALGHVAARTACQPILDPLPASRAWVPLPPGEALAPAAGESGTASSGCTRTVAATEAGASATSAPGAGSGTAAAAPVTAGSSTRERILSGGRTRTFLLHLPSGYAGSGGLPLVLVFHGATDRPPTRVLEDMERVTGLSALADREAFIVAYPLATTTKAGRTAWGIGDPTGPGVDDVAFVTDLIDHLIATLCVAPDRIYATGFSSGGGMTGLLACRAADRIAAFAAVSGAFYRTPVACAPARPVPILEFHGTSDTVPYDGGPHRRTSLPSIPQWLQGWADRDGCTRGPTVFFSMVDVVAEHWTGCDGASTVVHYRILNGKHTWPGQPGATQTIDATTLIWAFLSTHRLASVT